MSYCRWSSDNFQCDVYCYGDVNGGYTTHVAANRPVGDVPKTPELDPANIDEYVRASQAQLKWLELCERRPIGLPHDGESYNDPDLPSFLARLEGLKAVGYNVPDWVLKNIREEIAEGE